MKFFTLLLLLLNIGCSAQVYNTNSETIYQKALQYIESDISSQLSLSYQKELDVDTTIHVSTYISEDMIKNDAKLILCDLLQKRYGISKCGRHIATNSSLFQQVKDSITLVQSEFNTSKKTTLKKGDSIDDGSGYLLKFSEIINNTLSAQVGYSYNLKQGYGQGKTTIYYFMFNNKSNIEEVYKGSINYD